MIDYDERWRRRYNASLRRQELKLRAIEYKGGKCQICDYDNPAGLAFHHENPREKDFEISSKMCWETIRPELDKCVLLCLNCHAEVHAGYHPEFLVSEEDQGGFEDDLPDHMSFEVSALTG